jgi:3-carboxy-cis,cis-muconate cycloisomerase
MTDPFAFLVARGPIVDATTPKAWLQAMLDVEAALAAAQAAVDIIPLGAAESIAEACNAERFDVVGIFEDAALGGVPVIGIVERLRGAVDNDFAAHVHRGATSQDIMDTAAMVIVAGCAELAAGQLDTAAGLVDRLTDAHGATPMIGRTLGQFAVATTFGNVTRRWRAGLHDASEALRSSAAGLPVQLGGPVGDGASLGAGAQIAGGVAERLNLVSPGHSWHTVRGPIARVAGAWGLAATAVSAVATQIVSLAASDVGELHERAAGAGGSSSMAHKHNPIAAISARAAAMQVPGLVSTLLTAAGGHEFERAAGSWHAEWPALNAMLRATGSAIGWLETSLQRITVDPERMVANLAAAGAERTP